MAGSMGDLVIRLGLDIAALRGDVGKASAEMNKFFTGVNKSVGVMKSAFVGLAAGIAGALSVRALTSAITDVIDKADELGETVQKLGVNAEEFQKLSYAAKQSGASSEQLAQSIKILSKNMQELGDSGSEVGQALRSMGVDADDTATEALAKMSDAFAKMPDGAQKTALAMQLLGKAGTDLIPTLNQGSEGLARMGAELESLGGVMSADLLRAAGEFNDTMGQLRVAFQGFLAQLTAGMLPALQAVASVFADMVKEGNSFVSVGKTIGEVVITIAEAAIRAHFWLGELGAGLENLEKISRGDFSGVFSDEALQGRAAASQKALDDLRARFERNTQSVQKYGGELGKFADTVTASIQKMSAAAHSEPARVVAKTKQTIADFADWEKDEFAKANKASEAYAREREELHKQLMEQRKRDMEAEQRAYVDGWDRAFETTSAGAQADAEVLADVAREQQRQAEDVRGMFADAGSDFFTDMIEGTKSVSDAFKDMAGSIVQSLNRVATQKIAESIFGGGEAGGFDVMKFAGGIFPKIFGFAGGGSFGAGQPMVVGERGPEIIVPSTAGTVVPNGAMGSPINITVNVPPITDRRTADQAAASVGIAVQRAMKRNQ